VKVKCTQEYFDKQLKKYVKEHEVIDVKEDRAKVLIDAQVAKEVPKEKSSTK